jgi:dihydropteroate synthase
MEPILLILGARSTAPFRKSDVSEADEARTLSEAVGNVLRAGHLPISVDTARLEPAKRALEQRAKIFNDPFGLAHEEAEEMAQLAADSNASIVITAHERAPAKNSGSSHSCNSCSGELPAHSKKKWNSVKQNGNRSRYRFFSDANLTSLQWNRRLLDRLVTFRKLKLPILVGASRKKFLGTLGGGIPPEDRLAGSLSATAIAVYNGAHIIRTHDVKETKKAVLMASEIRKEAAKGLSHLNESNDS